MPKNTSVIGCCGEVGGGGGEAGNICYHSGVVSFPTDTDVLLRNVAEFQLLVNDCQHFVLALRRGLAAAVRTKLNETEVFSPAILF